MSVFNERDLAHCVARKPFIKIPENRILQYIGGIGEEILEYLERGQYIEVPFLGTFGVGNRNVTVSTYKRTFFFICDKAFLRLNCLRAQSLNVPHKQATHMDYGSVGGRRGLDFAEAKVVHSEIFASLAELIATKQYAEASIRLGPLGVLRLRLSFVKTVEFVFAKYSSVPYVTDTMRRAGSYNYNKLVNRDNLFRTTEELKETIRTRRNRSGCYNGSQTTGDTMSASQTQGQHYGERTDMFSNDLEYCQPRGYDDRCDESVQPIQSSGGMSYGTPRKTPLNINYDDLEVGIDMAQRATNYNKSKLQRLNNKVEEHTMKTEAMRSQMTDRIGEATQTVKDIKGYAPDESKYYGRTMSDRIDVFGFDASQNYCLSTPPRDKRSGYFDLDTRVEDKTKTMSVCGKNIDITTTKRFNEPYSRWDVKVRCPDCKLMHTVIPHEE